jgi:CheY-like chemotaxis protein
MLTYLIDDDPVSLFLTEQILRLEGLVCPILAFGTAEEALAYLLLRLPTELPELIFLDLNMPMMNGWMFLMALAPHAHLLQGQCRIYLLTSSLALADTDQACGHPLVAGIIHKPLGEEEIKAILTELAAEPKPTWHGIATTTKMNSIQAR